MSISRLDQLLVVAAEQRPTHAALIDPFVGAVTYEELLHLVEQICHHLEAAEIARNDRVGLCLPKSIGAVASIFASLMARACYVPVDTGSPIQRMAYIFGDCLVRMILVHRPLVDKLVECLADQGIKISDKVAIPTPTVTGVDLVLVILDRIQPQQYEFNEELAYILYTSGSTGKPKGVIHSHLTALSFIDWCSEEFKPNRNDRFSSHAPFHFDLSIFDLYVPIKHQATLVLIGEAEGKQPMMLASLISDYRLSVWYSTPSILRLIAEYGKLETSIASELRLVLYAGEIFPLKHLQALCQLLPAPRFYNLYGPTETNVCTFYKVPVPPTGENLPQQIGKVCSGDEAKVIDDGGREVPPGEEGELLISGGSVHLGYWNLPDRNATAFSVDKSGIRWYRTGDLVIDQGDGNYLFLGRRDRMVKRRGFRVELGEIESVLYNHVKITEVAVIAVPDQDSGVKLLAFIQWSDTKKPSTLTLKRYAAENLLSYMMPDRFIVLDSLPKTSTDKIDYQRLKGMH